ncbi:MAG: gluconokinase [Nocardioidaceae bacterium]
MGSAETNPPLAAERAHVVVMGVSGSGKTTVGEPLAERMGADFGDADDFHPKANVEKMASGVPLTDEDRWLWLDSIGSWLAEHADSGAVATCSALKRSYRDVLRRQAPDVVFLHLVGTPNVIGNRVDRRSPNFMPAALLDSQFDALEPPGDDERALSVDVSSSPDDIVTKFLRWLDDAIA